MQVYDLFNPTQAVRVVHDGIQGSQRQLKLLPQQTLRNVALAPHVVAMLKARRNDLVPTLSSSQTIDPALERKINAAVAIKPAIFLTGMWGLGDNLHQRAAIRELMKTHTVWLDTCHYLLYQDLVEQGLNLVFKSTRLRAQAKTIEREHELFRSCAPPVNSRKLKIWYHKHEIDQHGSILETIMAVCGLKKVVPDFSLPIRPEWRAKARALMDGWKMNGKPLMLYRPIVLRREWDSSNRNPDTTAYTQLFRAAREKYFVVSIADLEPTKEWIVGPEQPADVKLHNGQLDFETMAALFAEAQLVFCNAGFAPVLSQATGTPCIVVYGGRESFKTTQRAGAHLAPTLGIDPDTPCDCHTNKCNCDKQITLPPAIEKVRAFADKYAVAPAKVLIFATTYVDSETRVTLTDHWLTLHAKLNPSYDLMIVDSASPRKGFINEEKHGKFEKYISGERGPRLLHDFGDNVGHLSRKGKDGWGRAFTCGLAAGIASGYDFVVHIEGDSLFKLPLAPIIRRMQLEKLSVLTTPVCGMKRDEVEWIETGLMLFSTEYLKQSDFITKYDWPNRKERPTPEIVISRIIKDDVTLMPWKALRGDKNQITHDNIVSLNLDWVTHCHNDAWAYDRFTEAALGTKPMQPAPTIEPETAPPAPAAAQQVKLNLGCGTNKLPGWQNHDIDVDITKRLPWTDNSADFIFCEHCVEHIPYKLAIEFFKECHRVLRPGGVVRITVPSIEQIYKSNDPGYWQFTTKFQPHATLRGALHNIIYNHGHQTVWSSTTMEPTLYYAGFENIVQCETHKSKHPELMNVEGHHTVITEKWNSIESMSFEATKPGALTRAEGQVFAVVVAGGQNVASELAAVQEMLQGRRVQYFIVNDQIGKFAGEAIGVSLHPEKVSAWKAERLKNKYPPLQSMWANKQHHVATNVTDDWAGSSGLFATKIAMELGYTKIILCGVPMDPKENHFVRQVHWHQCNAFLKGWQMHMSQIKPFVRSMSGWTAGHLGKPDAAFLESGS